MFLWDMASYQLSVRNPPTIRCLYSTTRKPYLIIVFVRTCGVCLYSTTSNALLVYSGDEGTACCCVRITSGCCLTVCWANQIAGIALAGAGLCSAQYCCCIHSYFDFCSNCGAYNWTYIYTHIHIVTIRVCIGENRVIWDVISPRQTKRCSPEQLLDGGKQISPKGWRR